MLDDDGAPRRLTQRVVTGMRDRNGSMPEYASQRRKIIVVKLEARGRHLPLLQNAVGRYWTFDPSGRIGEGLLREQGDITALLPGAAGKSPDGVVDARRKFTLRQVGGKHLWTPTDEQMEPIVRDIWGMSMPVWRSLNLETPSPAG